MDGAEFERKYKLIDRATRAARSMIRTLRGPFSEKETARKHFNKRRPSGAGATSVTAFKKLEDMGQADNTVIGFSADRCKLVT